VRLVKAHRKKKKPKEGKALNATWTGRGTAVEGKLAPIGDFVERKAGKLMQVQLSIRP